MYTCRFHATFNDDSNSTPHQIRSADGGRSRQCEFDGKSGTLFDWEVVEYRKLWMYALVNQEHGVSVVALCVSCGYLYGLQTLASLYHCRLMGCSILQGPSPAPARQEWAAHIQGHKPHGLW